MEKPKVVRREEHWLNNPRKGDQNTLSVGYVKGLITWKNIVGIKANHNVGIAKGSVILKKTVDQRRLSKQN